jgi:DedD protein
MRAFGKETGSARSALAGAGLLLLGGCIGLVLGALLDAPRILMRRLQEPVQTVQIEADSEPLGASPKRPTDQLEEYRALQKADPRPEKPAPVPEVAAAPPAEPKPAAEPEPRPVAKPGSSGEPAGPRAEDLIEAIASRTERAAPLPDAVPPPRASARAAAAPAPAGSVVQVGAFPDESSAERVVDRLRRLGFDSYRSERVGNGGSRHRVRVRPGSGLDAQALAGTLRERGFDVWITRE